MIKRISILCTLAFCVLASAFAQYNPGVAPPVVPAAPSYPYTHTFNASLNNTTQYPCAWANGQRNGGDMLAQAFANIPATGGTVDSFCLEGPQTVTADVWSPVAAPILWWLGTSTWTVNANATIPSNFEICAGPGGSIVAGGGYTLTNNSTACTFGSTAGILGEYFEGTVYQVTVPVTSRYLYPQLVPVSTGLFLGGPRAGGPVATVVQSVQVFGTSAATISATLPNPTTAGNEVVAAQTCPEHGQTWFTYGVADSQGLVWAGTANNNDAMYLATGALAATETVTATMTGGCANNYLTIFEVQNVVGIDAVSDTQSTGGNYSGTITTTGTNELLIMNTSSPNTTTPPTILAGTPSLTLTTDQSGADGIIAGAAGDATGATATTYTYNVFGSQTCGLCVNIAIVGAFSVSGSAPSTAPPLYRAILPPDLPWLPPVGNLTLGAASMIVGGPNVYIVPGIGGVSQIWDPTNTAYAALSTAISGLHVVSSLEFNAGSAGTAANIAKIIGDGNSTNFLQFGNGTTVNAIQTANGTVLDNGSGAMTVGANLTVTGLVSGSTSCVQASTAGLLSVTSAACGTGTGANPSAAGQILYSTSGSAVSFSSSPILGAQNTTQGSLTINGSASIPGTINLGTPGASPNLVSIQSLGATGAYNFNVPTTAGSVNQPLLSQGGGSTSMTWGTVIYPTSVTQGGLLYGAGTNQIASTGATTSYALLVGGGTIGSIAVGGLNFPLIGQGASASPVFSTIAYPTSATSGGIPYFSSTTAMGSSSLLTQYGVVYGGGAATAPGVVAACGTNFPIVGQASAAPVCSPVSHPASLVQGGLLYASSTTAISGGSALTQYGVVLAGAVGSSPVSTAQGGSNFPLIGQGAANPAFSTIAYPSSCVSGAALYGSSTTAIACGALLTTHVIVQGGGAAAAPTVGNGDFTIDSTAHTLLSGASGLVDFSAITTASGGFKVPAVASCTSGADGGICYDTTAKNTHLRANAADALAAVEASALVTNAIPKSGSSTIGLLTTSTMTDSGTLITSTGTGGFYSAPASVAGSFSLKQGTASGINTTAVSFGAPTSVTSYSMTLPGTGPSINNQTWSMSALASNATTVSLVPYQRVTNLASSYTNATATPSTFASFTVDASTPYAIHCHGLYKAATGGAFVLTITGPSTPTRVTYDFLEATNLVAGALTSYDVNATGSSYPSAVGSGAVTLAATDMPWDLTIGFSNGTTAGTLSLQAQTISTNTLTIENGSYCTAQ